VANPALTVLEQVRAHAVQAAKQALSEARAELAQREALVREANLTRQRCSEELQSQRSQLLGARSALHLRRVEEHVRGLTLELRKACARLEHAQALCNQARLSSEQALAVLVEAETGRRAVAHVLSEQQREGERRRELREEDDAHDAWHAQQLTLGR
jgi:hypothetical protein